MLCKKCGLEMWKKADGVFLCRNGACSEKGKEVVKETSEQTEEEFKR